MTTTEDPDIWWKRFTPTPYDERDSYTSSSTVEDDFWRRKYFTTTKETFDFRKKITLEPFDERYIYPLNRNNGYIAVIVVGLVFMFFIFGAGALYCIKRVNQDMDRNTAATAADSRLTNPPPSRINRNIVPSTRNLNEATGNLNNASDKPPSYDVVVLSDLGVQQTKYPDVKPNTHECPPPKYENIVQKY